MYSKEYEIKCKNCGEMAIRGSKTAMYCMECSNKIYLNNAKESARRKKNGHGKKCVFCKKERQVIHHCDFNNKNNEKRNLLPLCCACHIRIHSYILKPFIKKMVSELKERRYTVIEISNMIGLSRQRIYQLLKK